MKSLRCPLCGKAFDAEHSSALPFCSDRCRQIDLGRWLNEQYTVPYERLSDEDEPGGNGASPNAPDNGAHD